MSNGPVLAHTCHFMTPWKDNEELIRIWLPNYRSTLMRTCLRHDLKQNSQLGHVGVENKMPHNHQSNFAPDSMHCKWLTF